MSRCVRVSLRRVIVALVISAGGGVPAAACTVTSDEPASADAAPGPDASYAPSVEERNVRESSTGRDSAGEAGPADADPAAKADAGRSDAGDADDGAVDAVTVDADPPSTDAGDAAIGATDTGAGDAADGATDARDGLVGCEPGGRYTVLVGPGGCGDGSGLVLDNATHLTWMTTAHIHALGEPGQTLARAGDYCASRGMRLPTTDEALGISSTNYAACAFCNWGTWTSSPAAGGGAVWALASGIALAVDPTNFFYALCVR